ncbi:MAG: hypothetical protein MMC33_002164 [Icmadophila ericetorum]|nr:hypothetical protein [Icmadophila ericetorum]
MLTELQIQLCATGTLGVAVVGYAFGRPEIPTLLRPTGHKRKALASERGGHSCTNTPSVTPLSSSRLPQKNPAFSSRSTFSRRPVSSSITYRNSPFESLRGTNEVIDETSDWGSPVLGDHREKGYSTHDLDFTSSVSDNTRSSWLRRMSKHSPSPRRSPISTPRPSTPSMSFSNTSTAPILSPSATTTPVQSRNRLVKRASSQRALQTLQGSHQLQTKSQMPTLRRPATSHQRSATLQQQYNIDENEPPQTPPSNHQSHVYEDYDQLEEDPTQIWYPFFRSREVRLTKESTPKKRTSLASNGHSESIRSVSAAKEDLPTLLLATSISTERSEEEPTAVFESAFSPARFSPSPIGSPNEQAPRSRASFSISDYFPSPSPNAWKLPRSGSLMRRKGSESAIADRRIATAPQSAKGRKKPGRARSGVELRPHNRSPEHEFEPSFDADSSFKLPGLRISSSPVPLPLLDRLSAFEIDLLDESLSDPVKLQQDAMIAPVSYASPPPPAMSSNSSSHFSVRAKTYRPSGAFSDRASTLIGSDNENSRQDGDETDYQSETVYDSIRTGATSSSHSGIRGPRIEQVFDTSNSSELLKQNLTALQDRLSNGSYSHTHMPKDFIAEEEETILTPDLDPGRSHEPDPSTPQRGRFPVSPSPIVSSSPPMAPLTLTRNRWAGFDDEDWPPDTTENGFWGSEGKENEFESEAIDHLPSPPNDSMQVRITTVKRQIGGSKDQPKQNIFEWSEQGSSPRPKTVHGQQNAERGSRSTSRRGPSALHLRSQSVPLPPDGLAHRGINSTAKLETWLLGSKGVSEEWDNDFEFDEEPTPSIEPRDGQATERLSDSGLMKVPKAILERQASVHGQFGQVKELTILVEELKRLRKQASEQGLLKGQSSELWKEAEGIINLATVDDDEQGFWPPRSPHSPGFDFDFFEDDSPTGQRRRRSGINIPREEPSTKYDYAATIHASSHSSPTGSKLGTPPVNRPRKDSIAKAKAVLEGIHQQRKSDDPPLVDSKNTQKKLPFDTTSLRDLVIRAGTVTKILKEIVRKAENASQSPERQSSAPPDPPFSQIFRPPSSPTALSKSTRMAKNNSKSDFLGGAITSNDNEINGHNNMKMMTVV